MPRQRNRATLATITTTVRSNGSPVGGATVSVTITNPAGVATTLAAATGSTGAAVVSYSMSQRSCQIGVYSVTSRATVGNATATATTSFVLN